MPGSEASGVRFVTGGKALVIGDDTRSFLAIIRSLGRQGITVHVAPTNFRSAALRSRYIAATRDLPPWMGDGAEWLAAITELLRAERYDLVIPCNETALLPLQRHRAALSRFARLAIPHDRVIAMLFDKVETRELARRVGVRVAAGRLLSPTDTAEGLLIEFGAPVVLKPRRSYALEQLASRGKVEVVNEPARLERLLGALDPGETVVEGYFSGQGVGISVLASGGRVLQAFEHHRVRELAGESFYRCSAPLSPDLVAACEAIVAGSDYTGVAMFEFKKKPSGEWILLEVNARPWGSMPLPVALGVDFPYRWYRLLTAAEEGPAVSYRTGVYGRTLLPDLHISLKQAEARRLGPIATAWHLARWAAEMYRIPIGKEVHDVLVRDDPRPGLAELHEIARAALGTIERRVSGAAARRRRRARAKLDGLRRNIGSRHIVFVCQGNICRSPFAEALLRARLGNSCVAISSAGMMPRPGRSTPGFGRDAAAAYGIDLSAHRSVWLSRNMVATASLVVVFDELTRSGVFDRYPDITAPVILLGDLLELGDISDPIDGGAAEFNRVYGQICAAIAELVPFVRAVT